MHVRPLACLLLVVLLPVMGGIRPTSGVDEVAASTTPALPGGDPAIRPAPGLLDPRDAFKMASSPWVAPRWSPGMWWSYEVTRPPHRVEEMTCGVHSADASTFHLACDLGSERAFNLLDGGPFIPDGDSSFRKRDGTLVHADGEADLLGFDRPVEGAWSARLFRSEFRMEHSLEPAPFGERVVTGRTVTDERLLVHYSALAAWVALLRLQDRDGELVLQYRLVDHGQGASFDAPRWRLLDVHSAKTLPGAPPLSAVRFQSDGSADEVVIIAGTIALAGTEGRDPRAGASVIAPDQFLVVRAGGALGRQGVVAVSSDVEGRWHVTATAAQPGEGGLAAAWAHVLRLRLVEPVPVGVPTAPAV